MSINRKRKLTDIENDTRSTSLPHSTYSYTPSDHRTKFSGLPVMVSKLSHQDCNKNPSRRVPEKSRRSSSLFEKRHSISSPQLEDDREQSRTSVGRVSMPLHHLSHADRKGRSTQQSDKPHFRPTMIIPPIDPTRAPSFLDAVRAQNRRRSSHHETFTSVLSSSVMSGSDAGPEIPSSVKDSVDADGYSSQDTVEHIEARESEAEQEMDTSSGSSITESDDESAVSDEAAESDSDVSKKSSSESGSVRMGNRHQDNVLEWSETRTRPAIMGRALFEQQHAEALKMRQAAESSKASPFLENRTPHINLPVSTVAVGLFPKSKRHCTTMHAQTERDSLPSNLSRADTTALRTLSSLIPPYIQWYARTTLLQQAQSRPSNRSNLPPRPANTSKESPPLQLTTTLTAARILILHLSATTTASPSNTDADAPSNCTNRPTTTTTTKADPSAKECTSIQAELLRIVKEREHTIQLLRDENDVLNGKVEGMQKELDHERDRRRKERDRRKKLEREKRSQKKWQEERMRLGMA